MLPQCMHRDLSISDYDCWHGTNALPVCMHGDLDLETARLVMYVPFHSTNLNYQIPKSCSTTAKKKKTTSSKNANSFVFPFTSLRQVKTRRKRKPKHVCVQV